MEQEQLRFMLQELLQEGLQKELAPIVSKLDSLETRFDSLETRFDGLETRFDGLETRFDGLENQLSLMRNQLDRMERAQTEDILGMLQLIDKKITSRTDRHEHQIGLLNNRLLKVEADVHKLQTT